MCWGNLATEPSHSGVNCLVTLRNHTFILDGLHDLVSFRKPQAHKPSSNGESTLLAQVDVNSLDLGVVLQCVLAELSADTYRCVS